MNYFSAISKRCDELNELGQEYLNKLPFMSNDEVAERLYEIAKQIDSSDKENPEWVDFVMDGHIPFYNLPKNGSIYFMLGYSVVAADARLRNLLEFAEGRDTILDLEVIAEQEIVDLYCEK